eukprot:7571408-Pyramimonas_sp.AAC.1
MPGCDAGGLGGAGHGGVPAPSTGRPVLAPPARHLSRRVTLGDWGARAAEACARRRLEGPY